MYFVENLPLDRRLAALAARQQGHVSRAQLRELGLGRGAIDNRIAIGRLTVVHSGVYAVGPRRPDPLGQAKAAQLAGGSNAVLSHSSAAFLWGINKRWRTPAEVTVTTRRQRAGIRVHRSKTLSRRDIRVHHGIRVTSPARTLLDNAPRYSDLQLARALNDLRHSRHLSLDALAELLNRLPHAPSAARLLPFVENDPGITRSMFEDAFLRFVRHFDLPTPQMNVHVAGHLVDAYFPEHKVIVELDSWEYHKDRLTFERDRDRDADALAIGVVTLRITWERLTGLAEREGRRFRAILAQRGPHRGGP
jgi:very-short-patch-repair endonuclease